MIENLKKLYPDEYRLIYKEIKKEIKSAKSETRETLREELSENDAILIVYPDHVYDKKRRKLKVLTEFLEKYIKDKISSVHILPFFPYSSDEGFSIIDFYKVREDCGTWQDIVKLSKKYNLMADLVLNHSSSKNKWFEGFLKSEEKLRDFFISFKKKKDVSGVFRPRDSELLTKFRTKEGTRYVWTTFSEDQIDLNFSNPDVLLEIIRIMVYYITKGVRIIRLDAIAYIWKNIDKKSVNEKEVHDIVTILKKVALAIDKKVLIITETNLGHKDNISFLKKKEADIVYNFSLSPLLLHTFTKGDSKKLTHWLEKLEYPKNKTYLNFTASHDGIGLLPLKGIVNKKELDVLVKHCKNKGGLVGWRKTKKGKEPYELNIAYRDAFDSDKAFMASQFIQMSIKGVPGIYLNSILGGRNWNEGPSKTGSKRAINRKRYSINEISKMLSDKRHSFIYSEYIRLLDERKKHKAFSPWSPQKVVKLNKRVFCLTRGKGRQKIIAIANTSNKKVTIRNCKKILNERNSFDLISREKRNLENLILEPFEYIWLINK